MSKRRCLWSGCGRLFDGPGSYCPTHRRQKNAHYNTKTYKSNRLIVLDRDNRTCYICGGPANEVDHIIPIRRGGTDDLSNLRACCKPHNSGKRDR
jgi:5-methylcytosine-specific restriction enzyme A